MSFIYEIPSLLFEDCPWGVMSLTSPDCIASSQVQEEDLMQRSRVTWVELKRYCTKEDIQGVPWWPSG